ncbi:MAG: clostripain-related cysteine peptidase [Bacillota bacterium]|nr:clostripain-related cysteine peptidase [Bacillota bacterium]
MRKLFATLMMVLTLPLCGGCWSMDHAYEDFDMESFLGALGPASGQTELDDYPIADNAEWTVLLYLCGTDLESSGGAATANLVELLDVEGTEDFNFVIQSGGTYLWQNELLHAGYLQRWVLGEGDLLLADNQPLASMAEADTLGDFLQWGVSNFPAQKYAVILWDHGGGSTAGLIFDERFNYDALSLDELAQGLSMAGVKFELIGFDTCLMASLETAAAIAPYGNYMVGSEEYEPGGGWYYSHFPQYMLDNPGCDGLEVGRAICDGYFAKCEYYGQEDMATLSVVDLSQVQPLLAAFDAMAAEMSGITGDISALRDFTRGASRAENYGGNNDYEGYTNMVDLGDLALNTKSVLPQTADALLTALFNAVKYDVHGASRSNANGLSVYYPLAVDAGDFARYAECATSGEYLRFLSTLTHLPLPEWQQQPLSPLTQAVQEDDYQLDYNTYISEDGYYYLHVSDGLEALQSVQFNLYYLDHDAGEYVLLGSDNDIDQNWSSGVFYDNFRGVWPTLNGYYCSPTLIAETEEYNLYSIPILLNGEQTNLRAAWLWNSEEYVLYGAWAGVDSDTGMSARDVIELQDGDNVTLLFDAVNWSSGETYTYEMGSFTVLGEVTMQESPLFDGEYMYEYMLIDLFGTAEYSDTVVMEIDGEDIYLYETY